MCSPCPNFLHERYSDGTNKEMFFTVNRRSEQKLLKTDVKGNNVLPLMLDFSLTPLKILVLEMVLLFINVLFNCSTSYSTSTLLFTST